MLSNGHRRSRRNFLILSRRLSTKYKDEQAYQPVPGCGLVNADRQPGDPDRDDQVVDYRDAASDIANLSYY